METWSDTDDRYWGSAVRKGQILLTGNFGTFRLMPVSGETCMPSDCVMMEGLGNAELRSWKAFGQWVIIMNRVSPSSREHAI